MKKGFTLIELLAVIIILAIVALIATPLVLNVIEDARKSAGESEANIILNGINNYCEQEKFKESIDKDYLKKCSEEMNNTIAEEIVNKGNATIENIVYSGNEVLDLEVISNNKKYVLFKNKMVLESDIKPTDEKCLDIQNINGVKTLSGSKFNINQCGTDLVIPDGVEEIKWGAFSRKGLTSVILPKSLKKIGNSSFSGNKLKYVNIPEGVEIIEPMTFLGNNLESIKFSSTIKTIGDGAFRSNKLKGVHIPNTVTTLGGGAFADNLIEGDAAFIYGRNSEGKIDETILNSYAGKNRKYVKFPKQFKTISSNAFWDAKVEEINLPEGLLNIDFGAFRGNKLKTVIIPQSIENIGRFAFRKSNYENPNLTKIINKTGRAFDWNDIILDKKGTPFITGTVGDVTITDK